MEIITQTIGLARLREMAIGRFGECDSLINLRPSQGNRSRGVDDPDIRRRIVEIVSRLVTR